MFISSLLINSVDLIIFLKDNITINLKPLEFPKYKNSSLHYIVVNLLFS